MDRLGSVVTDEHFQTNIRIYAIGDVIDGQCWLTKLRKVSILQDVNGYIYHKLF